MGRFRIATYNVHKCRGVDGRVRPDRIARVLTTLNADIVALQEVVSHTGRSAADDQPQYLAKALGYFCAMGEARRHRGGSYGNVTLSRWEFERTQPIDVTVRGRERRVALRTDVRIDNRLVHCFNLHLGTAQRERRHQAVRLLDTDLLRAIDLSGPRIVLGDFNEWVHGLATRTLVTEFHLTDLKAQLTSTRSFPAFFPMLHLDHIYFDAHLAVDRAFFHRTRASAVASDHLPLVADLHWV
jgi:endonuclease/exonuclease/phosphatase family metal-dependent hydrolase